MTRTPLMVRLAPWLFTLAFLAIWELSVHVFKIQEFQLPPPTTIARAIYDYWPAIYKNSWITLQSTLVGFALAGGQSSRMGEDKAIWAGYSWMTELLPYIGQDDLYTQFNFTKTWLDGTNIKGAYTVIPAFLNPADPRSTWDGIKLRGMALSHFAGMSGVEDRNVVAAELPRIPVRTQDVVDADHQAG
jgi:hypothetical protein